VYRRTEHHRGGTTEPERRKSGEKAKQRVTTPTLPSEIRCDSYDPIEEQPLSPLRVPAFFLHAALLCGVTLCCVVLTSTPSRAQQPAVAGSRDYEDCADRLRTSDSAKEAVPATIAECDSRFPGRRKAGGGYTYYDFMQNRHFDIAGPIPTTKELKQIDNEFISYLAARNATAVPSDNRRSLPEANQTTRAKPIAAAKPDRRQRIAARAAAPVRKEARRSRQRQDCRDTPLACGWTNFTTRIKTFKNDLFGATPKETLVSRLQRRDTNR
jgi:hypothetical protein